MIFSHFVLPFVPPMNKKTLKVQELKGLSFQKAVWTGLEPATPCVTGRYSNQLNYQTMISDCKYTLDFELPKSIKQIKNFCQIKKLHN